MPKFDAHKTTPPDSTKADDECSYRLADRSCCHGLNNLRPRPCHAFCVPKLDAWLRMQYPAMDDDEILKAVAMLQRTALIVNRSGIIKTEGKRGLN